MIGAVILLVLFFAGLRPDSADPVGPFPGRIAPAFHLSGPGGAVNSAALRGRPAILTFWASWCPSCRGEWPALQALARSGVRVVAVDDGRTESSPQAPVDFLRTAGRGVTSYLDPDGQVAERYLVRSLPTTYFLTARGLVAAQVVGPEDLGSFHENLSRAGAFRGRSNSVAGGLSVPILWPVPGLPLGLFTGLAGLLLAEFLTGRLAAQASVPVGRVQGLLDVLLLGGLAGGKLSGMIGGAGASGLLALWRGAPWSWPGAVLGAGLAFGVALRTAPWPRRELPQIIIPALLAGSGLALCGAGYFWPANSGWRLGSGLYQPLSLYTGLGLLIAGLLGARGRWREAVVLATAWLLLTGAIWPGSLGIPLAVGIALLGLGTLRPWSATGFR